MLKKGDTVEATWTDGLVITGVYVGSERGYIILKTLDGQRVICGSTVTLKRVV